MSLRVFISVAVRALRADMDAQLERWADECHELAWSTRTYEPLGRVGQ